MPFLAHAICMPSMLGGVAVANPDMLLNYASVLSSMHAA